jgi:hypothetical protein
MSLFIDEMMEDHGLTVTVQEYVDGVWVPVEHTILRVNDIHATGLQTTLQFPFPWDPEKP